ncbi:hypothetical protein AURANDRAFT_72731 [Aureococcus anophagefferens]|uniref:Uncharacterized protein n=1 Tax=Aureococcus anophagefferens TaxID=44056 RepID=F0YNA4_AURAN|nr:hypothetical protein AURANDRAFT_72731 [Aureococcus anophagefferens]EGB03421.1 hypothetical protein AURANDRAFT_72731 [Aureococcus anophagefferens]|eukprot:XP_009041892.1 hypothetical protein AURANDRAFT_72731 [Aureococcus anophagefferens]
MAHVAQIWALWWFFWQHVVGDVDWLGFHTGEIITSPQPGALPERTRHSAKIAICSVVWLGWLATAVTARRIFKRVMPAMVYVLCINMYVFAICFHAELFGVSGLAMTLCTNFASYLHQPGKRLFDVGFVLVPELGGGSRLEPLSDALTGAMPVATFLYVMLFLDRRRRCRCLTDWFRMMTDLHLTVSPRRRDTESTSLPVLGMTSQHL